MAKFGPNVLKFGCDYWAHNSISNFFKHPVQYTCPYRAKIESCYKMLQLTCDSGHERYADHFCR